MPATSAGMTATFPILSAFPTTPTTFPGVWFFWRAGSTANARSGHVRSLLPQPARRPLSPPGHHLWDCRDGVTAWKSRRPLHLLFDQRASARPSRRLPSDPFRLKPPWGGTADLPSTEASPPTDQTCSTPSPDGARPDPLRQSLRRSPPPHPPTP